MLPQVWLTSREIALKSWLHWPKSAFFMTKEPRYQITKNLKGDFEILALSWLDEPGQEDWFTEEFSLVTLQEICQQWVNILENFSPYSSWSKRMVLLPLCFWGKNAAKTELPKAILKKSWLRQQIKSCFQSSRLGTWSILVLPIKYSSQKYRMHLSVHALDNKYHICGPVPMEEKLTVLVFLNQKKLWSFHCWRS